MGDSSEIPVLVDVLYTAQLTESYASKHEALIDTPDKQDKFSPTLVFSVTDSYFRLLIVGLSFKFL